MDPTLLQLTFDAAGDPVCLRDSASRVVCCNAAFARLIGTEPERLRGRTVGLLALLGVDLVPGTSREVELKGRRFRVELRAAPFAADGEAKEGSAPATILRLEDVTEVRAAHEEIAHLRDDVRHAHRIRDEFLAIAAHELRTPLTTLLLQVQTIQRWTRAGAPPVANELLQDKLVRSERQVRRLVKLIEEMLDVSRMHDGRLALACDSTDLAVLAEEVVARHADDASRSGSAVRVVAPATLVGWWDRHRLDQVLSILLSNALQYGRGRPIDVRVDSSGEAARVSFRDQGIGIAHADQERIFERFERAVEERDYPGFGLGLWSARQILRRMGGEIRVESAPGIGSTFTVELPVVSARSQAVVAPRVGAGANRT